MRKSKKDLGFEMAWHERQARERVAWGIFGAIQRQRNFDQKLAQCKTEEERRRLIKDGQAQNARGFYVG